MLAQSMPLRALSRASGWLAQGSALTGLPLGVSIGLLALLSLGPVLATALILQEATALFWSILILNLILLFGLALLTLGKPAILLGVIVLWFALQRFIVALLAPHVSADVVRLLLTYKEGFYLVLVAAAAVAVLLRHAGGQRALCPLFLADVLAGAFLALLAIHFLLSEMESPQLIYLRRFAAPILLYLGGRLLIARDDQVRDGLRLLLGAALAVALFGLIERFGLGLSFWIDGVEAGTFYAKQVEGGLIPPDWLFLYRGVPDGVFISLPLEVPVRRLVSTYLEPTTLGSFLALALILWLGVPAVSKDRHRWLLGLGAVLLAVALTATLSRGAMLTALAAGSLFFLVLLIRRGWRRLWRLRYLALLPLVALLGFGFVLTTFPLSELPRGGDRLQDFLATRAVSGLSSPPQTPTAGEAPSPTPGPAPDHPPGSTAEGASTHFKGLTAGFQAMLREPLGRGLGAAGSWSQAPEVGGESSMGATAAQLGFPGFLLLAGFVLAVIVSLVSASLWQSAAGGDSLKSDLALALAAALFGLFLVSWFSESTLGLLANAFYFLFAGWALALMAPASRRLRFQWLPSRAYRDE